MLDKFIKKIVSYLAVAGIIISILIAWDQLTVKFAKAADVTKNEKNIAQLVESVKELVEEHKREYLRNQIKILNEQIYSLEKKYFNGNRTMSQQVKVFYQKMLDDKAIIESKLTR